MAFTLADIKKVKGGLDSISAAMAKGSNQYKDEEEGFFKLERDKADNGAAIIRFLPKSPDDELPWVTIYHHSFKGPTGKYYIERSLTTLDKPDPVAEDNKRLWATGREDDKKIAKTQARKKKWISNILVISNPANPELEGKVMPFSYGKSIFDMLVEATKIDELDDEKLTFNPFCPFTGANFKLRARKHDGWITYDKSGFTTPGPIDSDDEKLVEILNQMTPLSTHLDPEKFKTYEQLLKRFNTAKGLEAPTESAEDMLKSIPTKPAPSVGSPAPEPEVKVAKAAAAAVESSNDDIEDYFKSLMQDE